MPERVVDLPLTDAQREAMASRMDAARNAFEKGLAPGLPATAEVKRGYTVRDLTAFQTGEALFRFECPYSSRLTRPTSPNRCVSSVKPKTSSEPKRR
jgi:hypothetical protein